MSDNEYVNMIKKNEKDTTQTKEAKDFNKALVGALKETAEKSKKKSKTHYDAMKGALEEVSKKNKKK